MLGLSFYFYVCFVLIKKREIRSAKRKHYLKPLFYYLKKYCVKTDYLIKENIQNKKLY